MRAVLLLWWCKWLSLIESFRNVVVPLSSNCSTKNHQTIKYVIDKGWNTRNISQNASKNQKIGAFWDIWDKSRDILSFSKKCLGFGIWPNGISQMSWYYDDVTWIFEICRILKKSTMEFQENYPKMNQNFAAHFVRCKLVVLCLYQVAVGA